MKKLLPILFALIAAGCGGSPEVRNTNTPTANIQPAPVNANAADIDKTRDEVVKSVRGLKDLKFWTARTEIESMPALSGEIRYAAPDRFYFKQGPNEAIVIGDDTYTIENGKWKKSDFDMSGLKKIQENALTEDDVKKIKNVQTVGNETLNGRRTTVYTHSLINGSVETATKMWIDEETKLVMKSVVENRAGKQVQKIITTYDFETPVKIDVPKIGS